MFYYLTDLLKGNYQLFNAFTYISTRSIMAFFTALIFTLLIGNKVISELHKLKFGQSIRTNGPQTHLVKQGTPTMGGIMIIISVVISTLLWTKLSNPYIWIALFVFIAFGIVGYLDDYLKIKRKNSDGLSVKQKYLSLTIVALIAVLWIYFTYNGTNATKLVIPFLKNVTPQLGIFFIVLGYFTIVGSSNAVNITDGLDGLAIIPVVLVSVGYGIICWMTGNFNISNYLHILYIPNAAEIAILCAAVTGAGLGFFWFNSYPAQVFMGDVGSLSLGGLIGTIAVLSNHELLLIIMGGIFVLETISVMLQVSYFRYTKKRYGEGKRIFKMAPLHHHFEQKGWHETKVISRFWIIALICVLIALLTLKIR